MPSPPIEPLLFNIAKAAQLLGISEVTVRRETTLGHLTCVRVGVGQRTIRFTRAHIDEYIDRRTDDGTLAA